MPRRRRRAVEQLPGTADQFIGFVQAPRLAIPWLSMV